MAVSTIDPNGLNIGQIGGRRNILINSDFSVAQRSTSKTGVASNGYHTVDRWNYNDDTTGVLTMSQDTNAPDGFAYSFKSLVTTADTSIGATEQTRIEQRIESSSVQQLKYGTSDAQQVTVSFWVKTNKTGNWSVGLYMEGSGANISQAYTVNSADTWEYKQVTFAGNVTNSMSGNMRLWFTFAAGSDRTSGTSNTWSTDTGHRAVGQSVNLFDATSNYWQITGVQLEVSPSGEPTPFEHRSYGEELNSCLRFYYKRVSDQASGTLRHDIGILDSATAAIFTIHYPVVMRAVPSLSTSGTFTLESSSSSTVTSFSTYSAGSQVYALGTTSGSVGTKGYAVALRTASTSAYLAFDAEL